MDIIRGSKVCLMNIIHSSCDERPRRITMTTILRIDASARKERSVTRRLADAFITSWRKRSPDTRVILRDVGSTPPPAVSEEWIAAAFAGEDRTREQRALLSLSDELIEEVENADLIVMSVPMYNYGMPAALKAWFDQVVRVDRTFSFDLSRGDQPLEPILNGKTLVVLTSCGEFGFEAGGTNEHASHLLPHIRTCAKYLGAEVLEHVGVEYQEFGDARHEASRIAAYSEIPDLVSRLLALVESKRPKQAHRLPFESEPRMSIELIGPHRKISACHTKSDTKPPR